MITFTYEDGDTTVTTVSDHDGLCEIMKDFKIFLMHCTFSPDLVESISYDHADALTKSGGPQCDEEDPNYSFNFGGSD